MKKKMALALSLAMAATTLAPAAVSAADEQVTLTIMSSIQTEDEGNWNLRLQMLTWSRIQM